MGQRFSRDDAPIHRAIHSRQATTLIITNRTTFNVDCYWSNYLGKRLKYFTLAPGAHYHQPTFLTHPWSFEATDTPVGQDPPILIAQGPHPHSIFYPRQTGFEQVEIVQAGQIAWCPEHHRPWFYQHYARQVQTVLLCYHRHMAAASSEASSRSSSASGSYTSLGGYSSMVEIEDQMESREQMATYHEDDNSSGGNEPQLELWKAAGQQVESEYVDWKAFNASEASFSDCSSCVSLAHVPKDVLLVIFKLAAPTVLRVLERPPLPVGIGEDDMPMEDRRALFEN